MSRAQRLGLGSLILLLVLAGGIWSWNRFTVDQWVQAAQDDDPRNASFQVDGRYQYYVTPGVLVLDLTTVDSDRMSPVDLWRGLLQIAARAAEENRQYDRVVLARNRTPVFVMQGDDFSELGVERVAGQNPVYQLRTLPENLYRPDGEGAFGQWSGGMIGVLTEQMEDVKEAALAWVRGEPPVGRSR